MSETKFKRVLLKLSGEALSPKTGGIDAEEVRTIAREVKSIHEMGVEIGVVIGGGNIWRGKVGEELGMDRSTADSMGMLATIMNSLALADALREAGVKARVLTSVEMNAVAPYFTVPAALSLLSDSEVVIFGGGTGHPYFTTDTAAALRAVEIHADVLIKATKVDGIYDKDPMKYPDAVKFDELTYLDALNRQLKVMDATAISMCMENNMPLMVLNLWEPDSLKRALCGEKVGTLVVNA